MANALGLSVGSTQLVAVPDNSDGVPVVKNSILTIHDERPAEVGVPTEAGISLAGFVDRVGDPVGIVAADGSTHSADWALAEALRVMIADAVAVASFPAPPVLAAAVPAHWRPDTVAALRAAVDRIPALAPAGRSMALVSDAKAALVSLGPQAPGRGVVVLCDLGGSGTSITLADAARDFERIGDTVRHREFSGQQIDQLLLTSVLGDLEHDPSATTSMGALTRLRDRCRVAKERLSSETVTVIPVELPGVSTEVRLTRSELEDRIREPLAHLVTEIQGALERNGIHPALIATVVTTGGGASIPLVTQQLSDSLRCPVTSTAQPQLAAARGAAMLATRPAEPPVELTMARPVTAPLDSTERQAAAVPEKDESSLGLAWSEDDISPEVAETDAYPDAVAETDVTQVRPDLRFNVAQPSDGDVDYRELERMHWYEHPALWFFLAAAITTVIFTGIFISLLGDDNSSSAPSSSAPSASSSPSPSGHP